MRKNNCLIGRWFYSINIPQFHQNSFRCELWAALTRLSHDVRSDFRYISNKNRNRYRVVQEIWINADLFCIGNEKRNCKKRKLICMKINHADQRNSWNSRRGWICLVLGCESAVTRKMNEICLADSPNNKQSLMHLVKNALFTKCYSFFLFKGLLSLHRRHECTKRASNCIS